MKLIDFEYDGIKASDMGLIPCNFNNSDDEIPMGNNIEMNNVKSAKSDIYYSPHAEYSDAYPISFSICNDFCNDGYKTAIKEDRVRAIMRWMNRKKYLKFKPIYDDGSFSDVFYKATFNLTGVYAGNEVIGFNIEGMTNAPYGFSESVTFKTHDESNNLSFLDSSDEIGHIYPDMNIVIKEGGDLELVNSLEPSRKTIIKNCQSGEIITIDGTHKQISTNMDSHKKFYNDFNYKFPKVINSYNERNNILTSNLKCELTLTYNPIAKVGIIV